MLRRSRLAAFTLLEALVALLVISGSLLLFQALTKLLGADLAYQESNKKQEWLLFADQLEAELARSQFESLDQDKILVKQDGKGIAFGQSKADDFRKTDSHNRGYQPMITGLKETTIKKEGSLIIIHFSFKEGLERDFVYGVEEKN
ncbi:competence type IV pilus minor pilin ComGF [Streptococcus oricebi]|uniref:Competence protein ComGF n=1 Tax=Streptococcus oricebi TaxID=1547447 RepID=A0ABS5B547_9STRE|nr:competence type IV pilus minor pilin ComGF [Streptococcus oricebi]MBP2623606.1 competence protein ComGF [Streptococcus oricebi]